MKRSDLIKDLASDIILEHLRCNRNSQKLPNFDVAQEYAEVVLAKLEELRLINPSHRIPVVRMCILGSPYDDFEIKKGWQPE